MTTNIKQLSSNEDNARLLALPLEEANLPTTLETLNKDVLGVVRGFLSSDDNNNLNKTCKTLHKDRKVRVIDYKAIWDELKTDPKMCQFMPPETSNYEKNIENLYKNMRRYLNQLHGRPDTDIKLKGEITQGLQSLLNEIEQNLNTSRLTYLVRGMWTSIGVTFFLAFIMLILFSCGLNIPAYALLGLAAISCISFATYSVMMCDEDRKHNILKNAPAAPPLTPSEVAVAPEPIPPKFQLPLPDLKPTPPPLPEAAIKRKRKPIPRRSSIDLIFRAQKRANKQVPFPSYEPKVFQLTEAETAYLDSVD